MDWRTWFYLLSLCYGLSFIIVPAVRNKKFSITVQDFKKGSTWYALVILIVVPQMLLMFSILNLIIAPKDFLKTLKGIYMS